MYAPYPSLCKNSVGPIRSQNMIFEIQYSFYPTLLVENIVRKGDVILYRDEF